MIKLISALTVLALSAAAPVQASSKPPKEGGSSSGPVQSTMAGPREVTIAPAQASESLGTVVMTATMLAGSGAAKCRMSFLIDNTTNVTVALGVVGRTRNEKDEVVDNWVVNVADLAPKTQSMRLFSCILGGAQLDLIPTADFGWPPITCQNPKTKEQEACPVALKVISTVPVLLKR